MRTELKLLMKMLMLDSYGRKEPPPWLFILPHHTIASVTLRKVQGW